MDIVRTEKDFCIILEPKGRLDGVTSLSFEQNTQDIHSNNKSIIIDLSDINYISSAGLRVLLIISKKQTKLSIPLVICNMPKNVRDVFEVAGFLTIFMIKENRQEAEDYCSQWQKENGSEKLKQAPAPDQLNNIKEAPNS